MYYASESQKDHFIDTAISVMVPSYLFVQKCTELHFRLICALHGILCQIFISALLTRTENKRLCEICAYLTTNVIKNRFSNVF